MVYHHGTALQQGRRGRHGGNRFHAGIRDTNIRPLFYLPFEELSVCQFCTTCDGEWVRAISDRFIRSRRASSDGVEIREEYGSIDC